LKPMSSSPTALYIHVPFCLKKCPYCDFHSSELGNEVAKLNRYASQIADTINAQSPRAISTIYFGGGTPSLLSAAQIQAILSAAKAHFSVAPDAEISLEANPETLVSTNTLEKLRGYRRAGVNRISLGVQSWDDARLKALGRIHSADASATAYRHIRAAGFDNVNMDLMFAIPGQTLSEWDATLKKTAEFEPEHISLYNLTDDHGTHPVLEDDAMDLAMYRLARKILKAHGYIHYEISNFAKSGRECRHNITYWRNEDYIGIGEGAESSTTMDDPAMTVILGLRLLREGIRRDRFHAQYGYAIGEKFGGAIEGLLKQKLIRVTPVRILLTSRGLEVANYVFATLI